jgi:hypothetical protein
VRPEELDSPSASATAPCVALGSGILLRSTSSIPGLVPHDAEVGGPSPPVGTSIPDRLLDLLEHAPMRSSGILMGALLWKPRYSKSFRHTFCVALMLEWQAAES